MRRNPFTGRFTMTEAELAALCSNAAASAIRGIREQAAHDLNPTDTVLARDLIRNLRKVERSLRREAPTDIEQRLQGIGRHR